MFSGISGLIQKGHKIKGTVVLMRKNVLDVNSVTSVGGIIGQGLDLLGSTVDNLTAFLGRSVSLQLISATKPDGSFLLLFLFTSYISLYFLYSFLSLFFIFNGVQEKVKRKHGKTASLIFLVFFSFWL